MTKTAAVILAAAICASSLCACGSDTDSKNDKAATTAATTAAETTAETEAAADAKTEAETTTTTETEAETTTTEATTEAETEEETDAAEEGTEDTGIIETPENTELIKTYYYTGDKELPVFKTNNMQFDGDDPVFYIKNGDQVDIYYEDTVVPSIKYVKVGDNWGWTMVEESIGFSETAS